jgi:cytochrome c
VRTEALAAAVLLAALGGGCGRQAQARAAAMTGGDPWRGRAALLRYGCQACHTIPGIPGARAVVGPPLTGIADRVYLAGKLPNTAENMERWIRHPREVDSRTAMPDTGVTEQDARDIAAYLYTLTQ